MILIKIFQQKSFTLGCMHLGRQMVMNEKKRINRPLKMSTEELEQWLHFKRRGSKVPAKKGRGSFKRDKKVNIDF